LKQTLIKRRTAIEALSVEETTTLHTKHDLNRDNNLALSLRSTPTATIHVEGGTGRAASPSNYHHPVDTARTTTNRATTTTASRRRPPQHVKLPQHCPNSSIDTHPTNHHHDSNQQASGEMPYPVERGADDVARPVPSADEAAAYTRCATHHLQGSQPRRRTAPSPWRPLKHPRHPEPGGRYSCQPP
jgi:hypothetical protein